MIFTVKINMGGIFVIYFHIHVALETKLVQPHEITVAKAAAWDLNDLSIFLTLTLTLIHSW